LNHLLVIVRGKVAGEVKQSGKYVPISTETLDLPVWKNLRKEVGRGPKEIVYSIGEGFLVYKKIQSKRLFRYPDVPVI